MKKAAGISFLIIIYAIGVFGLNISKYREVFQALIPVNILITAIVVFAYHKNWKRGFVYTALASVFAGYLSEVIGVQTGLLFGNYHYGDNLGQKYFGVPIILGLNWFLLLYSSRATANYLFNRPFIQAIAASIFMVLLDVFLEPFAIYHGMWQWEGGQIPFSNYLSWFAVALLLQFVMSKFTSINNSVAIFSYMIMLTFFILNSYFV